MALRNRASLFCVLVMAVWAGESLPQTSYPTRAVRMVVPSSAGGGTDIVARILHLPEVNEKWARVARDAGIKPE